MRQSATSNDCEFRNFLYDTIILLGGNPEIAALLKKSMDFAISNDDIGKLRAYNVELINQTKDRLVNINKTKLTPVPG